MFRARYPAMPQPDLGDLWIKHQRKNNKLTVSYACVHCLDQRIFPSDEELRTDAKTGPRNNLLTDEHEYALFTGEYEKEYLQKQKSTKEGSLKPLLIIDDRAQAEPDDMPRTRVAIDDRILAACSSPARVENNCDSSQYLPPQKRKARLKSTPPFDAENRRQHISRKQLWNPDQDTPIPRSSFYPSNIASIHAQKPLAPQAQTRSKTPFYSQEHMPTVTLSKRAKDELNDIMREPETRPISQKQLVAEVKGIYAGLVMVEAKCVQVDNRLDTFAQVEELQTKLNNEQWQALISLHKTLLHENYNPFLASQHSSGSPPLGRLAAECDMPARMWRRDIHSFFELEPHRLPGPLDHIPVSTCLSYYLLALRYETDSSFEYTWAKRPENLDRYKMANQENYIEDKEVWTAISDLLLHFKSRIQSFIRRKRFTTSHWSTLYVFIIRLSVIQAAVLPSESTIGSASSTSDSSFKDWPYILAAVLISLGFYEAGRRFDDAWQFDGMAMASSAIAYLTMLADNNVSGLVIWTTWIFCAIFTALFARQDFLKLRFGQGHVVFVFMTATAIDSFGVSARQSSSVTSGGNTFFAALLPCLALAFFACGRIRSAWKNWPLQWSMQASNRRQQDEETVS